MVFGIFRVGRLSPELREKVIQALIRIHINRIYELYNVKIIHRCFFNVVVNYFLLENRTIL